MKLAFLLALLLSSLAGASYINYVPAPVSSVDPTTYTGLTLWLDPTDNTQITQSGGTCSQLNDKSGLGHHATQTGTKKPAVTTNAINGLQAFTFTSVLQTGMNFDLGTTQADTTACAIVRPVTNAHFNGIVVSYTTNNDLSLEVGTTNNLAVYKASVGETAASANNTFNTATNYWACMTYVSAGVGTIKTYLNNVEVGSATQGSASIHFNRSGGWGYNTAWGQGIDALMGEVVIYNNVNLTNLSALYTGYIKTKYGLP